MELYIEIAKALSQKLVENNIKHFLDFGTLLGAYRDGHIIPNDVDFDILYIDDENKNLNFLFSFFFKDIIKKFDLKVTSTNWGINYNLQKNNFRFEFYPVKIENSRFYPINLNGFIMPSFFIDELETVKLNNVDFPCPRHLNEYLIHRYGLDYKTPKLKMDDQTDWCHCLKNIIPIKEKYTAYTAGVFDLTHFGHFKLFEKIKKNFDKLIVGVHTDEDVKSFKRNPIYNLEHRGYMVSSCKYVDEIRIGCELIVTDKILEEINADYVIAGRDSSSHIDKFYQVRKNKLHLIDRTQNISTTELLSINDKRIFS